MGLIFLAVGKSFYPAVTGLILTGAGLAAGFPIMLGFVGERFKELSGTAFSIAFAIALIGNMIINYSMGFIAQHYGVRHLTTVGFIEFFIMTILCITILKKINNNNN
jgi:MFS family permease